VRMSALTTKTVLNRKSKIVRASEGLSSTRRRSGKFVGKGHLHQVFPVIHGL